MQDTFGVGHLPQRPRRKKEKLNGFSASLRLCGRKIGDEVAQTPYFCPNLKISVSDNPASVNTFLTQVTAVIEQNLANEQFGVSELADAMNMSRSNLLRKVKKESSLSVSQLINQVRLTRAMALLRSSSLNVSEVSHQVGFNTTSYFIKCFREHYGYPPGEVGKHLESEPVVVRTGNTGSRKKILIAGAIGLFIVLAAALWFSGVLSLKSQAIKKSIAVLPFKNDSDDSTNVYLINGLMESTLNNLQKIKDLRVISRTSSETYRNSTKSIPEMAKELNVSYFVEGSGQKIGDQILLNIQLIEASNDRHLWAHQYRRETKDIFQLQQEIAKNIAEEIEAIITPEEEKRIEKRPTEDLVAYDLFLKGKDIQALGGDENLLKAVDFYKKAIQQDDEFALAYSEIAIIYYYIDIFKMNKKYTAEVNNYADKAILYDSKLGESLVAKGVSYLAKGEYASAEPYLQKALEYNPNSASVIASLSDYYATYVPNTAKYLEYALKGVQLDVASQDSVTASYTYLRLGNALIQNGFVDESLKYIDKSLDYNPNNPFSRYVRAFILFAKTGDAKQTRDLLIIEYKKDTTRFDILQDIGKVSYFMGDYKTASYYYQKLIDLRTSQQLDIYRYENMLIGIVMEKVGQKKKGEELIADYKEWVDTDHSIYRDLGLMAYYLHQGDQKKAIEHLKFFSQKDGVWYWIILFLGEDPVMDEFNKNPECKRYLNDIKARFWKTHDELKAVLEEKELL